MKQTQKYTPNLILQHKNKKFQLECQGELFAHSISFVHSFHEFVRICTLLFCGYLCARSTHFATHFNYKLYTEIYLTFTDNDCLFFGGVFVFYWRRYFCNEMKFTLHLYYCTAHIDIFMYLEMCISVFYCFTFFMSNWLLFKSFFFLIFACDALYVYPPKNVLEKRWDQQLRKYLIFVYFWVYVCTLSSPLVVVLRVQTVFRSVHSRVAWASEQVVFQCVYVCMYV